jgi:hypothetical protein
MDNPNANENVSSPFGTMPAQCVTPASNLSVTDASVHLLVFCGGFIRTP